MAFPNGPLTSFMSPQEGPQIESSFMPQNALSAPTSEEQLSRLSRKVAPDEDDYQLNLIKQAKDRLLAQSTGVDPLISWLAAYGSADPRNKLGAAAQAMTQAVGQQDASKQKLDLDVLQLDLTASEKRGAIAAAAEKARLDREAKSEEKNKPTIETIFDKDTGREVKAYVYPESTGIPPKIIGGLKSEKPEKPEKVIGFDDDLNPVYEKDPSNVVYNTSEMIKIKGAARGTIEGMVIANKTIKELNDNKDAFGLTQSFETMTPDALQSILSATKLSSLTPKQRKIRAKVQEQAASVIKKFYGVAVSKGEDKRAANWQPKATDTYEQLMPKLLNSLEYAKEVSLTLPDAVYENSGATPEYKRDFFNIRNSLAEGLDPGSPADVIDPNNPLLLPAK